MTIAINGYKIRYNEYWGTWQVSHPEIGATVAEFKEPNEAVKYCRCG